MLYMTVSSGLSLTLSCTHSSRWTTDSVGMTLRLTLVWSTNGASYTGMNSYMLTPTVVYNLTWHKVIRPYVFLLLNVMFNLSPIYSLKECCHLNARIQFQLCAYYHVKCNLHRIKWHMRSNRQFNNNKCEIKRVARLMLH